MLYILTYLMLTVLLGYLILNGLYIITSILMQWTQQKINESLKKAKEKRDNAHPGSHDAQQGIIRTIANYW